MTKSPNGMSHYLYQRIYHAYPHLHLSICVGGVSTHHQPGPSCCGETLSRQQSRVSTLETLPQISLFVGWRRSFRSKDSPVSRLETPPQFRFFVKYEYGFFFPFFVDIDAFFVLPPRKKLSQETSTFAKTRRRAINRGGMLSQQHSRVSRLETLSQISTSARLHRCTVCLCTSFALTLLLRWVLRIQEKKS